MTKPLNYHRVTVPGLNVQITWSQLIVSGKKKIETRSFRLVNPNDPQFKFECKAEKLAWPIVQYLRLSKNQQVLKMKGIEFGLWH